MTRQASYYWEKYKLKQWDNFSYPTICNNLKLGQSLKFLRTGSTETLKYCWEYYLHCENHSGDDGDIIY